MKVLVYGATGSQQNPVVNLLAEKGHRVFAVTHQPNRAATFRQKDLQVVVADMMNRQQIMEITMGMDAVSLLVPFFLSNPADGFTYAKNAIDAAVKAKVKVLVWNSSGFILPGKIGNAAMDVRIDVLNYLRASHLPYIVLQPSIYAENLLGPWTAPTIAQENKLTYPTPERMPIGWIATRDVAAFVVKAIESPHLANQEFLLSGLENLTGNELAHKFSRALDREIVYEHLPAKRFGEILDDLFGKGAGDGAALEYDKLAQSNAYPSFFTNMDAVLEKLPVEMTLMEDWVKENKNAFLKSEITVGL